MNHEGIRYVPLDQVAEFYKFDHDGEGGLSRSEITVKFKAGEAQAVLNTVKCNLIHPVESIDAKLHLSERDLTLLLDPVLRPSKVELPEGLATLVIDPAYDESDPADLTLQVALVLRDELQRRGLKSVMIREEGKTISIVERIEIANQAENALYLRLRTSSSEQEQGFQVLSLHSPVSKASEEIKKASVSVACAAHWMYLQGRKISALPGLSDHGFGLVSENDYQTLACPGIEVRVPQSVLFKDGKLLAKALGDSMVQFNKAISVK
ncbi:N-acetylmuramoyl-L-alanine amidase [Verrucomicrobiaceae bacterium 227]